MLARGAVDLAISLNNEIGIVACHPLRSLLLQFFAASALIGLTPVHADDAILHVTYAGHVLALSSADVTAMPHQELTAMNAHDKATHTYSGFPARDLLLRAGAPLGDQLRGSAMRLVVVAHARDHYAVVYALAEFDQAFSNRTIFLVDREDGRPLGEGAGPLRFVIPGDERPARWARMITDIEVLPCPGN